MRSLRYVIALIALIVGLSAAARLVYLSFPGRRAGVAERAPASPISVRDTGRARQGGGVSDVPVVDSVVPVAPAPGAVMSGDALAAPMDPPRLTASSGRTDGRAAARTVPRPVRDTAARTAAKPAPVVTSGDDGRSLVTGAAAGDSARPVPMAAAPRDSGPAPAPWQASPRDQARDSAFVMTSSGRLREAIAVLDAWVRDHPADSTVAIDLARLRARSGDWRGSIAQYTALLDRHRTAELLFERGQTHLWSGDSRAGEVDLLASEQLRPRLETERQLGDLYRWQGDFARSASWYHLALRRAPGDSLAREGLDRLDAAVGARLLLPGQLNANDAGSRVQVVSDNAGFDLYALRLGQAFPLPAGASSALTIMGELRSTSRTSGAVGNATLDGWGVDATVSSRVGGSRVAATVGVLDHDGLDPMVRGSFDIDGFVAGAWFSASLRRSPAYEALWSPRVLAADYAATGGPSSVMQGQLSISMPFARRWELWTTGEYLAASDDNARAALQLALRRGLFGPVSLVYAAGIMGWQDQTTLYYSPGRYLSQSLGVELARYREGGLSFALRFAPGYAWIRDPAGTIDSTAQPASAFQLTGGMELGYRRAGWDLLLTTGLGSGREGGYHSASAMLYIRRSR